MYSNYNKPFIKLSDLKIQNEAAKVQKSQFEGNYLSIRQPSGFKKNDLKYSRILSPDPKLKSDVSLDSKYRNKSFINLEPSTEKISKMKISSGKLKNLRTKQDMDRKYKIPNFVLHTIVEIFTTNSKAPIALGLHIASKLLITSYIGISSERVAMRCVFRFITDKSCYKPRVEKFFYASAQYNVTVVAMSRVRKDIKHKKPIRLEPIQDLKLGESVFCAESTCFRGKVSNIEAESIGVTSHFTPLTGSPIFTSTWNLACICHTTSMTYKYTECTPLSQIFQILSYIRSRYNFLIRPIKFDDSVEYKETKDMKWFEFNGDYVEIFNIKSSEWTYHQSQFPILWQCAIVNITDDATLLIGGIRKELAMDEVYKYDSASKNMSALASMGVARSCCAAVFYDNCVFAIGGKYANTFCEKYLIDEDRWEYIPSMIHERYDLSAVVLNHSIYIIGGEPRKYVGSSIEKYDILREMWEVIPTKLPFPAACSPVCVIDQHCCGVLGGRGSKLAFIIEVSKYQSNDVSIKEGAQLAEELETVYSAVYSKIFNKIFIFNTAEGYARPILYKVHTSYLPL